MNERKTTYLFLTLSLALFLYNCQRTDSPNDNPVAGFSYTSMGSFPVTVQFVNTSTTPGGSSTFKWNFGDGTPMTTTTDAIHVYTQPGTYQVTLIQTPPAGAADTAMRYLILGFPQGPGGSSVRLNGLSTADFNFTITSRTHVAAFLNTSSDASSYLWNFGDGTTSTTESPVHTHNAAGTYHVNLSATNSSGTDTCGTTIIFQP